MHTHTPPDRVRPDCRLRRPRPPLGRMRACARARQCRASVAQVPRQVQRSAQVPRDSPAPTPDRARSSGHTTHTQHTQHTVRRRKCAGLPVVTPARPRCTQLLPRGSSRRPDRPVCVRFAWKTAVSAPARPVRSPCTHTHQTALDRPRAVGLDGAGLLPGGGGPA